LKQWNFLKIDKSVVFNHIQITHLPYKNMCLSELEDRKVYSPDELVTMTTATPSAAATESKSPLTGMRTDHSPVLAPKFGILALERYSFDDQNIGLEYFPRPKI